MACGMPIAALITCSVCPAVCPSQLPMQLSKHIRERRDERERQISSPNGKHTEHFSEKMSLLFVSSLLPFASGFFNWRRFQPRVS